MQKIIIIIAIIYSLFLQLSATETIKDPYKNVEYFKLKNGLEVYMLSNDKSVNTQISMKVKVGMDIETDENYGLSHLVEHIVFRDQRVPHHDYLDYIKEEGGTYVNGHTTRYTTEYFTTIDSNKSYWIAETFAQMIFDKNVTKEDLEIERGALQTEIGEMVWYQKPLTNLSYFLSKLAPREDFYPDNFSIKKVKDLPLHYVMQENNKIFTFDQVMQHYKEYYYPSNMILTIVGNFDNQKMRELIENKYGSINQKGTKTVTKPPYDAILNKKSYSRFYEGIYQNKGYIGYKYLLNDCKKNIIISAYIKSLALRIQQFLRNKKGKTYSVSSSLFSQRGGGIASIYFDGLRDDFEANIKTVQEMIANDIKNLDEKQIEEALKEYKKRYTSIEHDSKSLISVVNKVQHMHERHSNDEKTQYELYSSISTQEFKDVIQSTFVPENRYSSIYRDYYFFPQDIAIIGLIFTLIFILLYFNVHRNFWLKKLHGYTKRSIIFSRRLTNRFISFWIFLLIYLLSSLLWEWIKYFLAMIITGDPYYLYTLNVPYGYIVTIFDSIFAIVLFFVIYKLWDYHARIDVTDSAIYLLGSNYKIINKEDIAEITSVSRKDAQWSKIWGTSILFFKPLVKLELKNKEYYYLRCSNATHLEEDLNKWFKGDI